MIIVYLIILSIVCACFYRMGGCGPADLQSEWGWVPSPVRNFPKKRDVGSNICFLIAAVVVGLSGPWWAWLLSFGFVWASLSTYWDELFGYDNHWFHGFMIGLSLLPVYLNVKILLIAGLLGILMGVWSKLLGNATWEELGRGFAMPITLALILLI